MLFSLISLGKRIAKKRTERDSDFILFAEITAVNSQRRDAAKNQSAERGEDIRLLARKRKQRRQQHGSAWHWRQTDSWYFTEPGTKKRVPLFDEKGERIRGKENKEAARVALARITVADELISTGLSIIDFVA